MKDYQTCPHCGAALDHAGPCDCIQRMYDSLSLENKCIVGDLVDKLLEEQDGPSGSKAGNNVSKSDTTGQEGIVQVLMSDLTEEDREILTLFRQASPEKQAAAIAMAEELVNGREHRGEVSSQH